MHIRAFSFRTVVALFGSVLAVAFSLASWLFSGFKTTAEMFEPAPRLVVVSSSVARFKAFASRALAHPGYRAGGFTYAERSIA